MHNSQPQMGKQRRKAVKPEDLIPSLKSGPAASRRAQSPDEQLFLARMIHARYQVGKKTKTRGQQGPAVKKPRGPSTNAR